MKAAGKGNFFMNNDENNPFKGTTRDLLEETLQNPNLSLLPAAQTLAIVGLCND
jgi:hypothetical protein